MLKVVFEVDSSGYVVECYVTEIDELGNIIDENKQHMISATMQDGLFKPKWTGAEWVEDMPQSEIDELYKPVDTLPTDTEILGQQMTEREIESMIQGQQITDIDLRLFEMEVANNV